MDILKQLTDQGRTGRGRSDLRNEATTIEFEANRFKTSKVERDQRRCRTRGAQRAAGLFRFQRREGTGSPGDQRARIGRFRGRGADHLPGAASRIPGQDVRPGHPGAARGAPGGDRTGDRRPDPVGRAGSAGQSLSLDARARSIKIQNQAGVEASFRRSPLSIGAGLAASRATTC